MKQAALAICVLVLPRTLAGGVLRASRGDQPEAFSAWLHGRAAGPAEVPPTAQEPRLRAADVETERGALSLMSFFEAEARAVDEGSRAGDDGGDFGTSHDIGLAEGVEDEGGDFGTGHDIGLAEGGGFGTGTEEDKENKDKKGKKESKEKKEKKQEKKEQKKPRKNKADFMPECLHHVAYLLEDLDRSYTDEHLGDVLHSTCIHEKHFPLSSSDGFRHKRACDEFAELLVDARDDNLRDGTTDGFIDFCELYYEHLTGRKEAKKAEVKKQEKKKSEKKEKSGGGSWWLIIIIVGLILVVAAGGVAYWYYKIRPQA